MSAMPSFAFPQPGDTSREVKAADEWIRIGVGESVSGEAQ